MKVFKLLQELFVEEDLQDQDTASDIKMREKPIAVLLV
jgi:hypothetical protein